jgi:hypothetical protein
MTPKHTHFHSPSLRRRAAGRAISRAFGQSTRRLEVLASSEPLLVVLGIHNMNASSSSEQVRVHIMNFFVVDEFPPRRIHIMNFRMVKQIAPPVARRKITGAGQTGAPATNKGARNVMS